MYNTYTKILPSDLIHNIQKMATAWDPNQPFEFLVRQIQDAVDYAAHAINPYTVEQIVNTAYTLVFNTGVFEDECKAWQKTDHATYERLAQLQDFLCQSLQ